jgi:hypothetical protein
MISTADLANVAALPPPSYVNELNVVKDGVTSIYLDKVTDNKNIIDLDDSMVVRAAAAKSHLAPFRYATTSASRTAVAAFICPVAVLHLTSTATAAAAAAAAAVVATALSTFFLLPGSRQAPLVYFRSVLVLLPLMQATKPIREERDTYVKRRTLMDALLTEPRTLHEEATRQRRLQEVSSIGTEFKVSAAATGISANPAVAALTNGGFVVIWQVGTSDPYRVWGQCYANASGPPIGSNFQISLTATGTSKYPKVAALTDGGFIVTWWVGSSPPYRVWGQRYSNTSCFPIGSNFQISANVNGNSFYPSVAALTDGGFVVTWQRPSSTPQSIMGQRYFKSSSQNSTNFLISAVATGKSYNPSVAALTGGGYVVTWQVNPSDPASVWGQRYDASSGSPIGNNFRISAAATGSSFYPSVAGLPDGGFVVTWFVSTSDSSSVWGQRYDASGFLVGNNFQISDSALGSSLKPKIATLADGSCVVIWRLGTSDPYKVWGQRYDAASGSPIGNNFQISSAASTDSNFAPLKTENFVAVWTINSNVYAQIGFQIFNPSSQPTTTPSIQPSSQPSTVPSKQPSSQPSTIPSMQPSSQPSTVPSMQPSSQPSTVPSVQPSSQPSTVPSMQPSSQPSMVPTNLANSFHAHY